MELNVEEGVKLRYSCTATRLYLWDATRSEVLLQGQGSEAFMGKTLVHGSDCSKNKVQGFVIISLTHNKHAV